MYESLVTNRPILSLPSLLEPFDSPRLRQALGSVSFLAHILTEMPLSRRRRFIAEIDDGASPVLMLSEMTSLPTWALRKLSNSHPDEMGCFASSTSMGLLRDVATVWGPDGFPTTRARFETAAAALTLGMTVNGCFAGLLADDGSLVRQALRPFKLQRRMLTTDRIILASLKEACTEFAREIVAPEIAAISLPGPAFTSANRIAAWLLYRERDPLDSLVACEKWWGLGSPDHGPISATNHDHWPRAWPEFRTPEGARVIPLCSRAALAEEGAAMDNCTGRLARECSLGHRRIFSVRSNAGQRLSTFGVDLRRLNGSRPSRGAIEHEGPGNTCPPREASDIIGKWLDAAARGVLPFDSPARPRCQTVDELWSDYIPLMPAPMIQGGRTGLAAECRRAASAIRASLDPYARKPA